ncbi:MAG TPA: TonB-dependent receptor, partial [Bacteroidales bacterium]|nr:TonB-dependent receptor [Bacteroidales bacterium]
RSYGQSSITSLSVRGTSSAQSGIFWNGINIRMPSLGSTDLSLIPASLFGSASLVYGGNSIRYGSGTIGGAVFLEDNPDFSGFLEAGADFWGGSHGELGTNVHAIVSRKKYYFRLAIHANQSRNDFQYSDIRGENKDMENAAASGLGFNAHGALMLNPGSRLELFLWYQEALREIPPTTSMERSEAYQSDRAVRSSLQWKSILAQGVLNVKTAWFCEYENYTDPGISLNSKIRTNTWYGEAEYLHSFSVISTLEMGADITAEQADIDAYENPEERIWIAAFINYKKHFPRIEWDLVAGARQEASRQTLAPFTPSLGFEGPISSWLRLKSNISRNYRLPTLNEMYWQPGGNPDIEPEQSWNAEISLISELFKNEEMLDLNLSATAYSSYVDNWILWTPRGSLWYADNVQKVWARGVELDAAFKVSDERKHAEIGISYTLSRSTNEADGNASDIKGKQIIYTPLHKAGGWVQAGFGKWLFSCYNNFTGVTYTTSDNQDELPGFFITDMALRKDFVSKHSRIGISLRLNNIFNTDYQVVAYRPMPGRTYHLSFSLTFNK